MKTSLHLMLLLLAAVQAPLSAADSNDKLDAAKKLVERIREADPPRESGSTRTPEQAIKEYKESGSANAGYHLKFNPVPPP
ncbi:hypothetical protein [Prosthecobacter sp.]|uniref:hypothetical protein n=1 Tax=Prosthecobacter sp. TaxID=1965333 RepID=UPI001DD9CE2D|nr:hypothetical protein [Prosthecobacter sp.]MCB1276119.1 hypothetical protein [Prosthecobacter sp.]